jgi:hypothetical protein
VTDCRLERTYTNRRAAAFSSGAKNKASYVLVFVEGAKLVSVIHGMNAIASPTNWLETDELTTPNETAQ